MFQNGFFSPSPDGNTRRIFSGIHCEGLVELLEIKLTKGVSVVGDMPEIL